MLVSNADEIATGNRPRYSVMGADAFAAGSRR